MASQRPPWFRFPNIGTIRAPAPAPQPPAAPQPPIVWPTIQFRAPPPPPQPEQPQEPAPPPPQPVADAAPPQPPPSQPVAPAAPSPKKSPTPTPLQPRSPEVVATRSSPPKEQVLSSPRRSPTPPPPARSSPASKTQQVVSPRRSPTPPPPPSSPVPRAKPDSPPVSFNTTATTNANGSVKAATPVTLSPKGAVKPQSPLIVEKTSTPIQSPRVEVRPLTQSHQPSPLKLPPAHINSTTADDRQETTKFEQKNVLVQDTISKPPADKMHHGIPNSVNHNHNSVAANGKQVTKEKAASGKKQPDRAGTKMITLAGENKGAVMELTSSPNSPNSQREKKSHKIFAGKPRMLYKEKKNPQDGDHSSSESGKEAGEKDKTGRAIPRVHQSPPPMNAILNSNVQGINNSIVLHANCRHNDPGVHFSLARKANGGNSKEYSNQYHHQG